MNDKESFENKNYEILPDDYTQYDLSFKIIVIGDSGVGKSSLTTKATRNIFEEAYNATVGFEFFTFNIKLNEKIIKLQVWDTCGQELYRSLITNFYRNSSLAIIVYAVNQKSTFESIDTWLRELRINSNPDAKVFLIGNKIDLDNERVITTEEGKSYADDNHLHKFIEASAKTGINAQKIFIEAAKLLYDDYILYNGTDEDDKNTSILENSSSFISTPKAKIEKNELEKKNRPSCFC